MENLIPKISLKIFLIMILIHLSYYQDALKNHGFFVITDHNIPHELFNNHMSFLKNFLILTHLLKTNIHLEKMPVLGGIHLLVKKLL